MRRRLRRERKGEGRESGAAGGELVLSFITVREQEQQRGLSVPPQHLLETLL